MADALLVPLAVRVRNAHYDGLLTGYLHGAPSFQKGDPGGFKSASFVVDQRLGFRSDMVQPYSRIYIYNRRNGDTVFEGDVTNPGREISDNGALLQIQVDGAAERLSDWSGSRVFIDRDMTAWTKNNKVSNSATTVNVGEDRGGSGADAVTLQFPTELHVVQDDRCEMGYHRLEESGQELGWFNYAWDCGITNASWNIRTITGPSSTAIRSQTATSSGSGGSGAVVGGTIPTGENLVLVQMRWNNVNPSNTGTSDIVWTSILRPTVVARLKMKDGSYKTMGTYGDTITASDVVHDMLATLLSGSFDTLNSRVDAGQALDFYQLAYPNGVTPAQVLEDLMKYENGCTWYAGASTPVNDKFTFKWVSRSTTPRYEAVVWNDDYTAGTQATDQFNEVATRWVSAAGIPKITVASQTIPEMGTRARRFFQDLSDTVTDVNSVATTNAAMLADHRYPSNAGQVKIERSVVDLLTGRRIQPFEIEPGYMIRLVGVNPHPDALNATQSNGSSVCRIVNTDYSGQDHSVTLDLDAVPFSMFRAIRRAKPPTGPVGNSRRYI